jgi:hypothetical protein
MVFSDNVVGGGDIVLVLVLWLIGMEESDSGDMCTQVTRVPSTAD